MSRALSKSNLPAHIAQDAEVYVSILNTIADEDLNKIAIRDSYTQGFRATFTAMTAFSASALVASFLIKRFSLDDLASKTRG